MGYSGRNPRVTKSIESPDQRTIGNDREKKDLSPSIYETPVPCTCQWFLRMEKRRQTATPVLFLSFTGPAPGPSRHLGNPARRQSSRLCHSHASGNSDSGCDPRPNAGDTSKEMFQRLVRTGHVGGKIGRNSEFSLFGPPRQPSREHSRQQSSK